MLKYKKKTLETTYCTLREALNFMFETVLASYDESAFPSPLLFPL